MPDPLKKESGQSDHSEPRKRQKCGEKHTFIKKDQKGWNRTMFWTFSLDWVIGLSWFLFERVMCLEIQVYTPNNRAIRVTWMSTFLGVDPPWGTPETWQKIKKSLFLESLYICPLHKILDEKLRTSYGFWATLTCFESGFKCFWNWAADLHLLVDLHLSAL